MGFPSARNRLKSAIVSVTGPYYAKVEAGRFIYAMCKLLVTLLQVCKVSSACNILTLGDLGACPSGNL